MTDRYHSIPANDSKPHLLNAACKCQPARENNLVIHNAFDAREFLETPFEEEESVKIPTGH